MSLFELLERIIGAEGNEVEIELPEEKISLLAVQILEREAAKRGKTLEFKAAGPRGRCLVAQLEGSSLEDGAGGGLALSGVVKKIRFPRLHLNLTSIRHLGLISLLLLGIFLLAGGGTYWLINFLPRAEIVLTLEQIPMVREFSVVASAEVNEVNVDEGVIPGAALTAEVGGQKSTPATGTATTGEKATGTVSFVNGNPFEVHISAGDKIINTGDQSLIFLAVLAVDVPATSSSATVGVTAEKIGSAYNLAADKLFTIEGKEGISATNDAAFTGGESHQVTVVSSADQAKVLEELKAELLGEGREELQGEAGSGRVISQEAINEEELERHFLQDVGDQADTVGLTLKLELTTVSYKEDDLEDFVSEALTRLVPDGYELYPGELAIDVLGSELSDDVLHLSAKVSAQVIPQLDLTEVKGSLAGRIASDAQDYLASLPNVSAYELRLWPNLPESLRRVPRSTGRIRIELRTGED